MMRIGRIRAGSDAINARTRIVLGKPHSQKTGHGCSAKKRKGLAFKVVNHPASIPRSTPPTRCVTTMLSGLLCIAYPSKTTVSGGSQEARTTRLGCQTLSNAYASHARSSSRAVRHIEVQPQARGPSNAGHEPRPKAEAQRTLEGVGSMPVLGNVSASKTPNEIG